ncbi:hypothetical protein M9Y10_021236 [Tritrichomonas musculus]|uniref:Uncharacterized protein n=1 Tax=Tritrichomonas musculus TaxID=1915356 RepID=A0ABR2HFR0_9EUKA
MDEQNSFALLLNYQVFKIPPKFNRLTNTSEKVYNSLIFNNPRQYNLESKVSTEVLKSFISYWIEGEIPNITIENFEEYSDLSEEFQLMQDIIENKRKEYGEDLIAYNRIKNHNSNHRTSYEEKISLKLDYYLSPYNDEMRQIPVQTLYNIFKHPKRILNDHNLAYHFINAYFITQQNSEIFILISTLDGTKLNRTNLSECFEKREEHVNFMPIMNISFLENPIKVLNQLEQKKSKLENITNTQNNQIKELVNELQSIKNAKTREN